MSKRTLEGTNRKAKENLWVSRPHALPHWQAGDSSPPSQRSGPASGLIGSEAAFA
jgi:hypothetical protein